MAAHPEKKQPGTDLAGLLRSQYTVVFPRLIAQLGNTDRRALIRALEGGVPRWLLEEMRRDSGLRDPARAMAHEPEVTAFVMRTLPATDLSSPPPDSGNLASGLEHCTDEETVGAPDARIRALAESGKGSCNLSEMKYLDLGAGYERLAVVQGTPRKLRDGGGLVGCLTPEYQDPSNPLDDSMVRLTAMLAASGGPPRWVDEAPPDAMEGGLITSHTLADEENDLYVTVWADLIIRGHFDVFAHDREGNELGQEFFNNSTLHLNWVGTESRFCAEGGVVFSATPCWEALLLCTWAPRTGDEDEAYLEFEIETPFRKLAIKAVEAGHLGGEEFAVATFGQDHEDQEATTLAVMVHRVDRARGVWSEAGSFKIRGARYFGRNGGRVHLVEWAVADGRSQLLGLTLTHLDGLTARTLHHALGEAGVVRELFRRKAEGAAAEPWQGNRALKD